MGIHDLFSKRKAVQAGLVPLLQSENLPQQFRVQTVFILEKSIVSWRPWDHYDPSGNPIWFHVFDVVRNEHGKFSLSSDAQNPQQQCVHWLLSADINQFMDMAEVAIQTIESHLLSVHPAHYAEVGINGTATDAINDFNVRCRENGVAYQFEQGRIVPASSEFLHDEVVRPALSLLQDEEFRGAQEEFLSAHAKLRQADHKGAILDAGKAFESTMKTILSRKKWPYSTSSSTAKSLIDELFKNNFFPNYLQTQFAGLRSMLESGVPTVRNKTSGHGQGPEPVPVNKELAEYVIHMAAANIVFLIRLSK